MAHLNEVTRIDSFLLQIRISPQWWLPFDLWHYFVLRWYLQSSGCQQIWITNSLQIIKGQVNWSQKKV